MKKIMFDDKRGLTKAVLEGRKTMTRRIVPNGTPFGNWEETIKKSRYKPGEVVAVAQPYKDIKEFNPDSYEDVMLDEGCICEQSHPFSQLMRTAGWGNKMYVRADLMPHQIRITNVRVERLQDISDRDCLREGIYKDMPKEGHFFNGYAYELCRDQNGDILASRWYKTPREAFAALIDKVSGKGTWDSNPWVFVYEFALQR